MYLLIFPYASVLQLSSFPLNPHCNSFNFASHSPTKMFQKESFFRYFVQNDQTAGFQNGKHENFTSFEKILFQHINITNAQFRHSANKSFRCIISSKNT